MITPSAEGLYTLGGWLHLQLKYNTFQVEGNITHYTFQVEGNYINHRKLKDSKPRWDEGLHLQVVDTTLLNGRR